MRFSKFAIVVLAVVLCSSISYAKSLSTTDGTVVAEDSEIIVNVLMDNVDLGNFYLVAMPSIETEVIEYLQKIKEI